MLTVTRYQRNAGFWVYRNQHIIGCSLILPSSTLIRMPGTWRVSGVIVESDMGPARSKLVWSEKGLSSRVIGSAGSWPMGAWPAPSIGVLAHLLLGL